MSWPNCRNQRAPGRAGEAFYQGKIATATFFAANMLPKLSGLRAIIDEIMQLPEAAF